MTNEEKLNQAGYEQAINTNKKLRTLREKLRIAERTLKDIATIDNYIVAQVDAQQALQKISEVE